MKCTVLGLISAVAVIVSGCGKSDETKPAAESAEKGASSAGTEIKKVADEASKAAVAAGTEVKKAAEDTAKNASAAVTSQAQTLIDQAKSLMGEQKYQDALASLQKLATIQLTPDQQKIVDDLKAQITAALSKKTAADASGAAADALGIKK